MTLLAGSGATLEPETIDELAAALKHANDEQRAVLIRGAGTKAEWGRPAGRVDTILSTRRLSRVIAHQHGDLTATLEAGASLTDVNATLALCGQWLPLDPPHANAATIGGILATNDSGPLRHRFGTPRDLVIGVQLATTDGALPRAGGQVVKNVAGYDLSKLVAGSFGSLAAIATATFKLAPVLAASKTLVVRAPDDPALARFVRDMMASQLEPVALEVRTQRPHRTQTSLVRFASVAQAVDAQVKAAQRLAHAAGCGAETLEDAAEHAAWRTHATDLFETPGAIVRAHWLPASLADVVKALDAIDGDVELTGRAALGAGLIRIDGDEGAQARAIRRLRASSLLSYVVIVRGSDALKSQVDVWGDLGDNARMFARLKQAFDPRGILNAGRGPL